MKKTEKIYYKSSIWKLHDQYLGINVKTGITNGRFYFCVTSFSFEKYRTLMALFALSLSVSVCFATNAYFSEIFYSSIHRR